jgi:hypothetical protein
MSSRFRKRSRSAGFSLGEVLVALAIAAMMAAMLTRFVGSTRANAARIGEALEMATIGETLLGRVASGQGLKPGRTDGRSGDFSWHIEVEPVPFTAVARRVKEESRPPSEKSGADGTRTNFAFESVKPSGLKNPEPKPAATQATKWSTYRVAVAIESPSGRKHVVDTVRIGPPSPATQR